MKKLLIASTALSLAGGAAFAEMAITVGGSAELGLDYESEPDEGMSKHSFVHDFGVTFAGSGTTDGGLSFSASAGFDNKSGDGTFDTGKVSVSGSFGTLSIGDVGRGIDMAGGINDVGMNDIGVDDMVEDLREGTEKQIRYENNFGQISIAISAGTKDGMPAEKGQDFAAADTWVVVDNDDLVRTYYDDNPTEYGTNASDAATVSTFDELYGFFRDVDEGTVTVTDIGTDGVAGTTFDITGSGYGTGEDNSDIPVEEPGADTEEALTGDALVAFNSYMKAYDIGADGVVGGEDSDDVRRDRVIASNEVKMIAGTPAVKSETQYAFGMNFDAGGVTIGVGYDSEKTVSMGASFSAGEVSTNLLYVKRGEEHPKGEATGIGADMTYTMGASAVTLAYGRNTPEGKDSMDAVGMGVTHSLGGGATLNAGFGKVNETNHASIGIKFAF